MTTVYEYKPDKYSSHSKIINFLNRAKPNEKLKLLDVGCSRGFIATRLDKKKFELYGIEIDPDDAAIARKNFKEVREKNIEHIDFGYEPKTFDVVLLNSVIEHVSDPWKTIKYLNTLLKDNGLLVISTANIGNIYARMKLMFGNFDYEERGIFDKTHLRFFTIKSFRELMRYGGFTVLKDDHAPIPLPLVSKVFEEGKPLHFVHKLNYYETKLMKTLLSFEMIFYCMKTNAVEHIQHPMLEAKH